MFSKMYLVLALGFSIQISSCSSISLDRKPSSRTDGIVGNGGGACVCRSQYDQKITFAELIDITQAKAQNFVIIKNDSQDKIFAEVLKKFPKEALLFIDKHMKEIKVVYTRKFEEQPETPDYSTKICKLFYSQSQFKYDSTKKTCDYEQLGIFNDNTNTLTITENIFNNSNLSELNKTALLLHEIFYKLDRKYFNAQNSDNTKNLIGELFSNKSDNAIRFIEKCIRVSKAVTSNITQNIQTKGSTQIGTTLALKNFVTIPVRAGDTQIQIRSDYSKEAKEPRNDLLTHPDAKNDIEKCFLHFMPGNVDGIFSNGGKNLVFTIVEIKIDQGWRVFYKIQRQDGLQSRLTHISCQNRYLGDKARNVSSFSTLVDNVSNTFIVQAPEVVNFQ